MRRVRIIVDPAVRDSVGTAIEQLLRRRRTLSVDVEETSDPGPGRALGLDWLDRSLTRPDTDVVIAVGGGRVMDGAKLLVACRKDSSTQYRIESDERCGWKPLPPVSTAEPLLVAIPTTVGTGSEMSRFACFDGPAGRKLVQGDHLQPDLAIVDTAGTAGLSTERILESIVEIFARTAGPYTGTGTALSTQDRLTESICARLVRIGAQIESNGAGEAVPDTVRSDLAHLSGVTHSQWLNHGRDAFSYATWFLATELAEAAHTSKATAMGALLPQAWASGYFVAADRVAALWHEVSRQTPGLPESPGDGLRTLFDGWHIPSRLPAFVTPIDLAKRTMHRWGAGLPMLGRYSVNTVAELYGEVLAPVNETLARRPADFTAVR